MVILRAIIKLNKNVINIIITKQLTVEKKDYGSFQTTTCVCTKFYSNRLRGLGVNFIQTNIHIFMI